MDGGDDGRRGVKGVEGRALGAVVFLDRQQGLEFFAQGLPAAVLVLAVDGIGKDRQGHRPEAGEASERLFLLGCCRSLLRLNGFQGADGGENIAGLGLLAAGNGHDGRRMLRMGGVRFRTIALLSRRRCLWRYSWLRLGGGGAGRKGVKQCRLAPRCPYSVGVRRQRNSMAASRTSGSSSFCGDAEGKRSSSSLRAISRASEAIWLGSLPGRSWVSSSFQASWFRFSSLA